MVTKNVIGRIAIYPPTSIGSPYYLKKFNFTQYSMKEGHDNVGTNT